MTEMKKKIDELNFAKKADKTINNESISHNNESTPSITDIPEMKKINVNVDSEIPVQSMTDSSFYMKPEGLCSLGSITHSSKFVNGVLDSIVIK